MICYNCIVSLVRVTQIMEMRNYDYVKALHKLTIYRKNTNLSKHFLTRDGHDFAV